MGKEFELEIRTPDRLFFKDRVDMVVLPAIDGENGVMAGHENMVTALLSGILRIQAQGAWRCAVTSEGYAMVYGDRVVVLLQSIEWPQELDKARAQAAYARAVAKMETTDLPHKDMVLARMSASRARARLKLLDMPEDGRRF